MSQFYKIVKNLATRYLNELLPKLSSERTHFRLRSREHFTQLLCRTSTLQKSFFPSAINGWNSRDLDVRNSVSHFKAKLGQFSFRILTIGYMIVLCQGVHLLIKPASLNTFSCIAQGMPLNVMFSLPLLLIFSVKHVHRVVMLGN